MPKNIHASSATADLIAAADEYERINATGYFTNGEPITAAPDLAAELAEIACDLRTEIARRS